MFASSFKFKVDPDKNVVKVSPTSGTILKWVVIPTLLSLASLIPLFLSDRPISVADELDEALSEEQK